MSDSRAEWVRAGERVAITVGGAPRVVFRRILGERGRPWVTLLHGFPTSSWDWAAIAPALAPHFCLLTFDFLGFGESDKPARHRYSIHEQADLVEALWRDLAVDETALVAHDYGDSVAEELLARAREGRLAARLGRVTLLNGGLWPDLHRPLPIQKLLHHRLLGPIVGRLATRTTFARGLNRTVSKPLGDDELDAHWAAFATRGGRAIAHRLIRYLDDRRLHAARWVAALEAPDGPPRQFVWGARDPVSGAHVVPRITERLPSAPRLVLDDVGHYPQLEAPERVARAIVDFTADSASGEGGGPQQKWGLESPVARVS
jgi:pimeloyl-ACP methyl ester carboxylesterase